MTVDPPDTILPEVPGRELVSEDDRAACVDRAANGHPHGCRVVEREGGVDTVVSADTAAVDRHVAAHVEPGVVLVGRLGEASCTWGQDILIGQRLTENGLKVRV